MKACESDVAFISHSKQLLETGGELQFIAVGFMSKVVILNHGIVVHNSQYKSKDFK